MSARGYLNMAQRIMDKREENGKSISYRILAKYTEKIISDRIDRVCQKLSQMPSIGKIL